MARLTARSATSATPATTAVSTAPADVADVRGALARSPVAYTLPPAAHEQSVTSADGARLHVETYGRDGDPAVLLIHGWTCSTVFWAPVIRELTSLGHRVIAYDQRGHGRTPAAQPHTYGPATLADDLCAVLDAALAPGERAVIAGHSMGAMTLAAAAGRASLNERAAALVLCSTGVRRLAAESRVLPFRTERGRVRGHRLLLRSRLPMGPVTRLTKKALKYGTMGPLATPEQVDAVTRVVHRCPSGPRGAWGAMLGELDLMANVPALTAPTAVIVGAADRLTPVVHARELAAALPDCAGTHELPGRGHMVPVEEPETVVEVVASLVRRHLVREPLAPPAAGTSQADEGESEGGGAHEREGAPSTGDRASTGNRPSTGNRKEETK